MRFGELFAGIGGFSLGLERAGMKCAWQVEIDPYARAVLNKHWPDVPKHDDVRTFPPTHTHTHTHTHTQDFSVDLICGGFPCQDISYAGKRAGLMGCRSGLWTEFARVIGVLRPSYVVVENVAAILSLGMGTVVADLSSLGYDAEWHVIPASAVGAPHRRERIWIVGHAQCHGRPARRNDYGRYDGRQPHADGQYAAQMADAGRKSTGGCVNTSASERGCPATSSRAVDTCKSSCCGTRSRQPHAADADSAGRQQQRRPEPTPAEQLAAECNGWWQSEPDVGRVAHGVPSRVDRLRCLGNAVVPQVVEVIGRAILAAEARMTA